MFRDSPVPLSANGGIPVRTPIVSLFSGAGGLDLAFERSGAFTTILMVENQKSFCETLLANRQNGFFCDTKVLATDIRELNPKTILSDLPSGFGLIGGPPCESFSTMGRRQSTQDARGMLIFEFVRWASHPKVDFFLFENVPELMEVDESRTFKELLKRFRRQGFKVKFDILNSADFGAATLRKRLFILGWRRSPELSFPSPTHVKEPDLFTDNSLSLWVPVMRVIDDLLCAASAERVTQHKVVNHSPEVTRRFSELKPGSYDNVRKRSRLNPDRPSPSLVAGNFGGTRNHIHPTLPRELTNREIARIQGFPDHFIFVGPTVHVAKQITNAVPIPLGEALARSIASIRRDQGHLMRPSSQKSQISNA
jgi:DNA (cytosine-5)-methyltransferase 1